MAPPRHIDPRLEGDESRLRPTFYCGRLGEFAAITKRVDGMQLLSIESLTQSLCFPVIFRMEPLREPPT